MAEKAKNVATPSTTASTASTAAVRDQTDSQRRRWRHGGPPMGCAAAETREWQCAGSWPQTQPVELWQAPISANVHDAGQLARIWSNTRSHATVRQHARATTAAQQRS